MIGDETMIDKPEVDKTCGIGKGEIKIAAPDEETSVTHSSTVTFAYTQLDRSIDKSVDIDVDKKPWWKFW